MVSCVDWFGRAALYGKYRLWQRQQGCLFLGSVNQGIEYLMCSVCCASAIMQMREPVNISQTHRIGIE
jgi:hypothetical protein